MRHRLLPTVVALNLVVLAACSTTVRGSGSAQTSLSTAATPSTSSSESSTTAGPSTRSGPTSSTPTPSSSTGPGSTAPESTVRIGLDTTQFYSYNQRTFDGYSVVGQNILAPVLPRFNEIDQTGATVAVAGVGSYQVISSDPYIIEFALTGNWSDGVPVSFGDFLLAWVADGSGLMNEDGSPLFDSFDYLWEFVDEPRAEMDATTFQLTFNQATPLNLKIFDSLMPAHVALKSVGLTPADFAAAVAAKEVATLASLASFYNTAWDIPINQDVDTSLMLSAGPYVLSEINADGSVVLTPNDEWAGDAGELARIEFVPLIGDKELAAALAEGQIDLASPSMIDPAAVTQTFGQLDADEFTRASGFSNTYEHLDFNIAGLFQDPVLRQAFAACVPRKMMLDKLFAPIDPSAEVLQSSTVPQWSTEYVEYAPGSPGTTVELDVAGARSLLEQSGKLGQAVTLATSASPRRQQLAEFIKSSCDEAGFAVTIDLADDFFTDTLPNGEFDVALFGWQVTGGYSDLSYNLSADGPNNYGKYDNPQVTELLASLVGRSDAADYQPVLEKIDALLWSDLPTLPLFALPAAQYWSSGLTGPELARDGIFTRTLTQWSWN